VRWTIDTFFAYEYTRWTAYPEALSVLEALSEQGLRLGLFSNATDDPFIQRLVDRFGFAPWLDPVLSSAATGIRKPDPAAFEPFLSAWALPPEAIAVAGDRLEADILGAQQAGMVSIWLRSRADARQEGQEASRGQPVPVAPTATINRLTELPQALAHL
jgi:putative hydrolase of the HAD superfamily